MKTLLKILLILSLALAITAQIDTLFSDITPHIAAPDARADADTDKMYQTITARSILRPINRNRPKRNKMAYVKADERYELNMLNFTYTPPLSA